MEVIVKHLFSFFIIICLICPIKGLPAIINVDFGASDDDAANGNCSLIDALRSANNDVAIDGCIQGSGADTIVLPSAVYNLSSAVDFRFGANGTPCVDSIITILGQGSSIVRAGSKAFRNFCVTPTGNLTIQDATISGGLARGGNLTAQRGGGIMSLGAVTTRNVVFSGNQADVHGGAMLINGGTANIINTRFLENSADKGGAVRTDNNAVVQIQGSYFSMNTANFGGGLFANNSNVNVSDSNVENNETTKMGGGLYFSGTRASLLRSVVKQNKTGEKGAGIRIDNASNVSFQDLIIDGNTSDDFGGGIYLILSSLTISKTTISNNTSVRGGGLYVDVAEANIENATFSGNNATIFGGAIYVDADESLEPFNSRIDLNHVTVIDNQGEQGGGGIWVNPISKATLNNSIVALNGFRDCAGPGVIDAENGNWFGDQFCNQTAQGDPGIGVLLNNGGFTNTHALSATSEVVDGGFLPKCPATDQRGSSRPFGGKCDIGAYEYRTDLKVLVTPSNYLLLD